MGLVLLCDFDGTITNLDTALFLLDTFVEDNWRIFDSQYREGKITLEECIQAQYSMFTVPKHLMLKELEKTVSFRSNFRKLIDYCRIQNIPFIVVSAGLDFVINHFLKQKGFANSIKVHSVKTTITENGIELAFPKLLDRESTNFKDDLVINYKKQGHRVIYIGDGTSDYQAIKQAHFRFSITNSRLAELCRKSRISHQEIDDFQEVIDVLKILIRVN